MDSDYNIVDNESNFLFCFFTIEHSARVSMQKFIQSSRVVIDYLHKLFISMNLGIDWWKNFIFVCVLNTNFVIIWINNV